MDTTNEDAPNLLPLCQLTLRQLLALSQGFGDELLRRAYVDGLDPRLVRLFMLGSVHLVELRGRLRQAREIELENPSAAPVPSVQRGADQPGAPTGDTTTTGAAESPRLRRLCSRCGHLESSHAPSRVRTGKPCDGWSNGPCECTGFVAQYVGPEQCELCKLDPGHEGECRPVQGPETAPLLTEHARPELQSRGPRGPEAAEGAGAAGRAKQGPVDLAHHLAVLKGGAA